MAFEEIAVLFGILVLLIVFLLRHLFTSSTQTEVEKEEKEEMHDLKHPQVKIKSINDVMKNVPVKQEQEHGMA